MSQFRPVGHSLVTGAMPRLPTQSTTRVARPAAPHSQPGPPVTSHTPRSSTQPDRPRSRPQPYTSMMPRYPIVQSTHSLDTTQSAAPVVTIITDSPVRNTNAPTAYASSIVPTTASLAKRRRLAPRPPPPSALLQETTSHTHTITSPITNIPRRNAANAANPIVESAPIPTHSILSSDRPPVPGSSTEVEAENRPISTVSTG